MSIIELKLMYLKWLSPTEHSDDRVLINITYYITPSCQLECHHCSSFSLQKLSRRGRTGSVE